MRMGICHTEIVMVYLLLCSKRGRVYGNNFKTVSCSAVAISLSERAATESRSQNRESERARTFGCLLARLAHPVRFHLTVG